uniref:Immunoglobulin heavy constant zeta n=1 Tax=Sinocyclocheilus grahami TaxID=75366 RepID=A0A672LUZ5_SINGR
FISVNSQTPTLSLIPVTTRKSTFVMCVIEDFYPMDYYFPIRWKVNDIISQTEPVLEYKLNDEGLYTAQNLYKVSSETWNANTNYTCEVTHQGKTIIEKKNFKSSNGKSSNDGLKPSVVIYTPDSIDTDRVSLVCEVTSPKLGNVYIMWKVGEEPYIKGSTSTPIHQRDSTSVLSILTISKQEYENTGVVIYTPDSIDTDRVSLVCEVTSPKLGNVYIMWKVGEQPYIKGSTSTPIHQRDSTSVLSILTISKQEYEKYNTITCSVIHANVNNRRNPLQVSTSQRKQPEFPCD